MTMVYVPLITYGRAKYDYNTDLVGIFYDKKKAAVALFDALCRHFFIFDNDGFDHKDKQKHRQRLMKSSNVVKTLKSIVVHYGDSYFLDGWEYRIEEHKMNSIP